MTPKDKANLLVNQFMPFAYRDAHDMNTRKEIEDSNKNSAIECACIVVDEVLEEIFADTTQGRYIFWRQVKEEILKL